MITYGLFACLDLLLPIAGGVTSARHTRGRVGVRPGLCGGVRWEDAKVYLPYAPSDERPRREKQRSGMKSSPSVVADSSKQSSLSIVLSLLDSLRRSFFLHTGSRLPTWSLVIPLCIISFVFAWIGQFAYTRYRRLIANLAACVCLNWLFG